MSENRTTLEVIAPTIDEAIAKGLEDLGLPEDAVDVEILDEGTRGVLGLGSRHARVRLSIKSAEEEEAPSDPLASPIVANAEDITGGLEDEVDPQTEADEQAKPTLRSEDTEEDITLQVTRDTIDEMLEKMKIKADVSVHYGEPDDDRSRTPVRVDIRGKDLSILIGRRAETLNSLQYITRLIIGKELGRSVPLVVDVEGYRLRRDKQIRQLARRMAEQAINTNRRQVLEPMPANERRIVHIELRDNPDVTTESVGEEPNRKVTIIPQ